MFGSDLLEIGVGLVLVFLCVSLICSAAREALETVMKTRALDLERGIRVLLADPDGTGLTKALFDHPIISALFGGIYDPTKLKATKGAAGAGPGKSMPLAGRRDLPSYIPSAQFAAAILDLVARGPVAKDAAGNATPPPLSVAGLRETAAKLDNEQVRRALLSAIDYAGDDLDKLKANIEGWFNGTMDRVSGWYKRRTQMILFLIGVLAAIILNVDAITIAHRISVDETLRKALVAQAESVVAKGAGNDACDITGSPEKGIQCLHDRLSDLGLPIGWSGWAPAPQAEALKCEGLSNCLANLSIWQGAGWIIRILIGWLIIAFGVMLGAPFWFDVLNKFMIVRSTVSPGDKAKK